MSKVKRNGNVEVLRFLFSVLIVFHHFEKSVFNGKVFTAGYLGVEFFFIITGVFLGKKLKAKNETDPPESFGSAAKEGAEYVWKRICSIYPYFFLATILGFAARIVADINKLNIVDVLNCIGDFGLGQLLGLSCLSSTGTMWYLCAMFFALLLIYPFARKYYDAFVYSFAMFFPPVVVGMLIRHSGDIGAITGNVFGVFNLGILRAIAMISIGLVVNELADRVKELPVNRLNRFAFTACELVLYPVLFAYLVFVTRCKFDYFTLVLMAFLLIITMSEKSCLYGKLDGKLSMFLGKASIPLFLCHYFWVNSISDYSDRLPAFLPEGMATDVILGLVLTAVTSAAVYFGGNLLRFLFRKGKAALFAPPKITN